MTLPAEDRAAEHPRSEDQPRVATLDRVIEAGLELAAVMPASGRPTAGPSEVIQVLLGKAHHALGVLRCAHVGLDRPRADGAPLVELRGEGSRVLLIDVGDHDRRARLVQPPRDSRADAAGGAGDQRRLTTQVEELHERAGTGSGDAPRPPDGIGGRRHHRATQAEAMVSGAPQPQVGVGDEVPQAP